MEGTAVSLPSDSPLAKLQNRQVSAKPKVGLKASGKLGAVVAGASLLSDWIIANAPDAWNAIQGYFASSGMTKEDIDKMPRGYVLERMANYGINPSALAELGLSSEEMRTYASLFADYAKKNSAAHDANQVARESTGDAVVDRDLMNLNIARCASLLGLSGRQRARALYDLAMTLNSLTESDVEAFERHESMYGSIRAAR